MNVKIIITGLLLNSVVLKAQDPAKCLSYIRYGQLTEATNCASANKPGTNDAGIKMLIETQVALEKGDTATVNKLYEQSNTDQASNNYSVCARIILLISKNELEKAKAISNQFLANHKNISVNLLADIAEYFIRYKHQEPSHTLSWINQLEKEKLQNSPDVLMIKGDYFSAIGDHGSALNQYNRVLDTDYEKSIVHFKKALAYKNIRNFSAALEELETALTIRNNFPFALNEKAEVLFELKQNESAIYSYREYLKMAPYDIQSKLKFGTKLFGIKDYEGARTIADEVRSTQPNNLSALKLRGYALSELGSHGDGLVSLKTYLENADSSMITARDYETIAELYLKTGNESLAIEYYSKLSDRTDAKSDQLSAAGSFLIKKSLYEKAFQIYASKLNRFSGSSTDYFNTGRAALALNRYETADSMFAKVCELQPTWPNGYLFRANANSHLDPGTADGRAFPFYSKYIELAEADSVNLAKYKTGLIESYRYLGYYYYLKKDREKSKAMWKKVLEIDPNDKQAKEALKQL